MSEKEQRDRNTTPISSPNRNQPGDRVRAVASALVDLVPGGGLATALADDLVPTGTEKARQNWEDVITNRTNEHSQTLSDHNDLLDPKETIEGIPAELIVALANACPDGLGEERYDPESLSKLLPTRTAEEIEDAAHELASVGLTDIQYRMGSIAWYLSTKPHFYELVDHQVMGWDTWRDAAELAQQVLGTGETRAATLHQMTGWSKRRFNPAFRAMLTAVGDGRISKNNQFDYVSPYFSLMAEDKVRLRKIIERYGSASNELKSAI